MSPPPHSRWGLRGSHKELPQEKTNSFQNEQQTLKNSEQPTTILKKKNRVTGHTLHDFKTCTKLQSSQQCD